MTIPTPEQSPLAPARPVLIRNTTLSRDGTTIEYFSTGDGTGLVIVPGSLAIASDMQHLAALLAPEYTVHIVQRRGRGGSGPQGVGYSLRQECEDLHAVFAATGSSLLFGHSYGGLIALQFARSNPTPHAVAVYEPGVSINNSIPADWIPKATAELEHDRPRDAFLTFMRGINPQQTGRMPRAVLSLVLRAALPRAQMEQNLALMSTALREHDEVGRLNDTTTDYAQINARTLILLGGARSSAHTAPALRSLTKAIPTSELVTLPGLNHFAPEQKPHPIARALRNFLQHPPAR